MWAWQLPTHPPSFPFSIPFYCPPSFAVACRLLSSSTFSCPSFALPPPPPAAAHFLALMRSSYRFATVAAAVGMGRDAEAVASPSPDPLPLLLPARHIQPRAGTSTGPSSITGCTGDAGAVLRCCWEAPEDPRPVRGPERLPSRLLPPAPGRRPACGVVEAVRERPAAVQAPWSRRAGAV